jgi:hypothetical protein
VADLTRIVPRPLREIIRRKAIMECRDVVTAMIARDGGELPPGVVLSIVRADITDLLTRPEPPSASKAVTNS